MDEDDENPEYDVGVREWGGFSFESRFRWFVCNRANQKPKEQPGGKYAPRGYYRHHCRGSVFISELFNIIINTAFVYVEHRQNLRWNIDKAKDETWIKH